jgi:dTDP-4-dehydrorhamnose reductase
LKKKILILGIDGMIGHKIAQLLEQENNLFGTTRKTIGPKKLGLKTSNLIKKDFDKNQSLGFLDNLNPDIIINCIGITTRRINNDNISNLEFINSRLPHYLNEWTEKNDKRLIHFSTDCVYSGKSGMYTESDNPDAIDLYGKSKAIGEINNTKALTIRTSLIGREVYNHTELFEWLYKNKSGKVYGYENVYYSGLTTIRMSKILEKIINYYPDLQGVFNISSKPITKYSLLKLINRHFKFEIQVKKDLKIKSNKVLISKKITEITDIEIPTWEDLILEFKEDCVKYSEIYKK